MHHATTANPTAEETQPLLAARRTLVVPHPLGGDPFESIASIPPALWDRLLK